jgi:hypothetical protein
MESYHLARFPCLLLEGFFQGLGRQRFYLCQDDNVCREDRRTTGTPSPPPTFDRDYDKGGLLEPLVITFYFSISATKIVQLIILRNQQDI